MTQVALNTLNRDENGFFLMVEGSLIDWGGHDNDVLYAISEMEDFEAAIATVLAFIENNPDTLLIITADHETGGLSIGADDIYDWDVDLLRKIHATSHSLGKRIKNSDDPIKKLEELTSIKATKEEGADVLASMNDSRKIQKGNCAHRQSSHPYGLDHRKTHRGRRATDGKRCGQRSV